MNEEEFGVIAGGEEVGKEVSKEVGKEEGHEGPDGKGKGARRDGEEMENHDPGCFGSALRECRELGN